MVNFSKRGFTMIEMLIVIALVMILGTISILNLSKSNRRNQFDTTVQKVTSLLNLARDRSVSGESNDYWGVFFWKGGSGCGLYGEGAFYDIFSNNSYVSKDYRPDASSGRYGLPAGVVFDTASMSFPYDSGCSKEISFGRISGLLNDPASAENAIVKLKMFEDDTVSSTISVSALGVVSYTGEK